MTLPNLGRLFRRITLTEQATLSVCKTCGATVPWDLRYVHARRDELLDHIDQYVNDQVGRDVQPLLPPF